MRRYVALTFLFIMAVSAMMAQEAADSWQWNMERGDALYKSGKFAEAYEEYRKARQLHGGRLCDGKQCGHWLQDGRGLRDEMNEVEKGQLDYRMAMCAYHAEKEGARELLEHYLDTYPATACESYAQFALGNIYFDREAYSQALPCYAAVKPAKLYNDQSDEYNFKRGYGYFVLADYNKIKPYFSRVNIKSPYYPHAQYCLGYAEYRLGNHTAAKRYFSNIASHESYAGILPFYYIQIEFNEGNYRYVTENSDKILQMVSGVRAKELMRIIGESWFHLSSWKNAVRYLTEYEKSGARMSRVANYMVGFSNYMMKNWNDAEKYLSRVPGADDKLSQNASYHLADVYLGKGDKVSAKKCFSIASVRGYDEGISEDALFNYGKLQFEQGGGYFNEAINVLGRYLSLYPTSKRAPQVKEYLAAAYYNSSNYEAAYQALSQMSGLDNNARAALQKITYSRALQYYREGDYAKAGRLLDESLRNRSNAKYTALAGYWQGNILFKDDKYREAIRKYEAYLKVSPKGEPENIMVRYDLGYASFNERNWAEACKWFDDFLAAYKSKDRYRADALNRRGDIEFSGRHFWQAIEFYDAAAALGTPEKHYAAIQRAIMLGLVDRSDRKIEALNMIISRGEGSHVSTAMYELGATYIAAQKYNEAQRILGRLIELYPVSPKYIPALLDLGLVYSNLGDNRKALSYYKQVVERDKYSPYGHEAMNGIRGIYVDNNDVDSYFNYAQQMDIETDLSAMRRDSIAYVAAQKVYLSGNMQKAAQALDNYIKNYPTGTYVSNALYFLGENSLAMGQRKEAYGYFARLAVMYNNSFTLAGMERAASLAMEFENYSLAARIYGKMSQTATNDHQRDEAFEGHLKAVVAIGDPRETERVATDVIARTTDRATIRLAKHARAKSLMELNRGKEALELFTELGRDVSTAEGAEAAYRVIESEVRKGNNARLEKLVNDFAQKNSPHVYWLAKSFILLGDMYSATGDSFQARATYQSIIDGYPNTNDGVIDDAKNRIGRLEQ